MEHVFKMSDFIENYSDKENDKPCKVLITSLPEKGIFLYKGELLTDSPIEIESCDIPSLIYKVKEGQSGIDQFTFKIIDSNINNPKPSNMAIFRINVGERPNQPPSSVGDNTVDTPYNTPITITQGMLTTQTTPPYADPENDPAYMLKVLTLPTQGTLKYNNSNVIVNQEIPFSGIATGGLTYTPNGSTITSHSVQFTFAISDTGSQQFTS